MENAEQESSIKATFAGRSSRSAISLHQVDDWCEKGIFALVLGVLVFSPLAMGAVRPSAFVIVEWLTIAIMALWLCRFWLNPKHRLLWPPVCWGVAAFMVYAVARYWTADVEYVARQEMIRVLIYGFLFLAILHNLYHLERIQVAGLILMGLGTLLAMYGVAQFLTGSDYIYNILRPVDFHKRGSGTFINPNHFAGFVEMLLPLALAFTLTGRSGPVRKVLMGYATLAMFAGIFVSVSVGGWISTGVTLIVLFFWLMQMRDYRLQGLLLLAAMTVLSVSFFLHAELSPNRLDHLSTTLKGGDVRLHIWKPALKMWQDHRWFGVGPGHFDVRFREYRGTETSASPLQARPEYVHNDYLNTLVDWGLLGGGLVLLTFGLFYRDVLRSWKYVNRRQNDLAAKRSNKASFVMGGALGVLAILVHSFFDFNLHIPSNAILLVALLALVTAHFRYATERYWHTVKIPLRLVITLLLVGGMAYLAPQSWRLAREAYWLQNADNAQDSRLERIKALENAVAAEGQNYATAYELGEVCRLQAWDLGTQYEDFAQKAIKAFSRSIELNRFYPYSYLGCGICLDFLKKYTNAAPFFEKAVQLDPESYYTADWLGWHNVQLEEWAKAKEWFEKSCKLKWNRMAFSYLEIIKNRMAELQVRTNP